MLFGHLLSSDHEQGICEVVPIENSLRIECWTRGEIRDALPAPPPH